MGALIAALLCSLPIRADEADDRYAVAAGHYAHKRWQFAAEEFQAFVQKHPGHPKASQAVFFLAEALTQLGKLDEAATLFRDYLTREPTGPFAAPALFRAGEIAYLAGKLDSAKGQLERFLSAHPNHKLSGYVLPYLGDVALTQDDAPSAEGYFRRGLSAFPQGPMQDECRFGLAQSLEKQGKPEEAERLYLALAAKTSSPLADEARFHWGALQYAAGKLDDAVEAFEAFESTLAESPWQATARLGRGWALFKLGRLDEAKSVFASIASDAKFGVEARYWLGLTEKAQKNWQSAAKSLLETAADNPNHKLAAPLRFHAGDCLSLAGQHAAADEQFRQVIASAGSDSPWIDDAMRGRIQVALQTGDHATVDGLAAEFAARFAQSPLATQVQRMLARSLLERKQYQRAADVIEPLVAAGHEGESGLEDRYFLSLAYEGLDRHQEASDVLAPVVDSATGDLQADAQLAQASALMKLQRFDQATVRLEAALGKQPTGDEAVACLGNLAICYAETDRLDEARKRYAELIEKHPDHELIATTTEQLAEAAYDAGDVAWSNQLFTRLADDRGSAEHRAKGLLGLGWTQFKSGQLEEAARTLDRLLGANPDPPTTAEAAFLRGQILQQLGEADPALAMYDLVIENHREADEHPKALWAAALLRDSLEQDQEAVALYEQLATAYPEFPEIDAVFYNWAWALDDLGRPEESSKLFERLHAEHPKSTYWADATLRLAQRAFEAKDTGRSRQLVAEVLAGKPVAQVGENARYLEGQIAAADGRWDDAGKAFEAVVRDYPESSLRKMAEYGIAESMFRRNDHQAAGELLDRIARREEGSREPWLAAVHLRRAQVLCHQEKWDEAREIASRIETEFPDFAEQYEVDYVIGRCLSNRAEFEAARESYRKVIRSPQGAKTETAAKAQLMIAESYYHQKNYPQALREYLALEILYDFPTWQTAALLQAGKCHEMLGEWKHAADEYARLVAEYPDSDFVEEASKRLDAAKRRLAGAPEP